MFKGKATVFGNSRALNIGGVIQAVNVTTDMLCCTLNTRYEAMALPLDILNLAHYPKTVVLYTFQ